jgi:glycosyltransferase involved in cell wall biosynthesis
MVVFPSVIARSGDQEGFGLVPVEALGCGCPVVASDLPTIRSRIEDGVTGLLARPGDPQHLAERIIFLLERPQMREQLAAKGREYVVRHHDWQATADRFVTLINNLLEIRPKPLVGTR